MYFAESSTALGISLHSLVQQTLRTVSVVSSLYCIHTFVYHSHSNHSVPMLQWSRVWVICREMTFLMHLGQRLDPHSYLSTEIQHAHLIQGGVEILLVASRY